MHAISLFLDGKISGDFPGEAERYIEHTFNDKAVALWTSGAAGDQNPLYVRANSKIADARIHAVIKSEGQITAEEAIRVMNHIRTMNPEVKIEASQQDVICPARRRLDTGREGAPGKYEDFFECPPSLPLAADNLPQACSPHAVAGP